MIDPMTPLLLLHLRQRDIFVIDRGAADGEAESRISPLGAIRGPDRRTKDKLLGATLRDLALGERFLVDTGCYQVDAATGKPIPPRQREADTVLAAARDLIERDMFHLPAPVCVIEDYTENDPGYRIILVARETHDGIVVEWFQPVSQDGEVEPWRFVYSALRVLIPNYDSQHFNGLEAVVSFHEPVLELFGEQEVSPGIGRFAGVAAFILKKFVVLLASRGIMVEERPARNDRGQVLRQGTFRHRPYKVVRVPFVYERDRTGRETGLTGTTKRRCHWVRGHMWGRHTRPPDQQHWTSGFFRGDPSLGWVDYEATVIRERTKQQRGPKSPLSTSPSQATTCRTETSPNTP